MAIDLGGWKTRGGAGEHGRAQVHAVDLRERRRVHAAAQQRIIEIAGQLKAKNANVFIEIEGHTDSLESEARSLELSTLRAAQVKDELIRRGIDPIRLESIGMGQSEPIATNSTEEGRALNQRIDLIITSYKNE